MPGVLIPSLEAEKAILGQIVLDGSFSAEGEMHTPVCACACECVCACGTSSCNVCACGTSSCNVCACACACSCEGDD